MTVLLDYVYAVNIVAVWYCAVYLRRQSVLADTGEHAENNVIITEILPVCFMRSGPSTEGE